MHQLVHACIINTCLDTTESEQSLNICTVLLSVIKKKMDALYMMMYISEIHESDSASQRLMMTAGQINTRVHDCVTNNSALRDF